MSRKTRHKPPSRVRYEKEHPTLSARIPRALYDRIVALCRQQEKSFAVFLREALERRADVEEDEFIRAYVAAAEEGAARFGVTYRCCGCRKPITVSTEAEKTVARTALRFWGHSDCQGTSPDSQRPVFRLGRLPLAPRGPRPGLPQAQRRS